MGGYPSSGLNARSREPRFDGGMNRTLPSEDGARRVGRGGRFSLSSSREPFLKFRSFFPSRFEVIDAMILSQRHQNREILSKIVRQGKCLGVLGFTKPGIYFGKALALFFY